MIYVVSGYMRSGTSMMMAAVRAGGMDIVHSAKRTDAVLIHSDNNYRVNPEVLELEYFSEIRSVSWPRQHDGRVIKVPAPFLKFMAVAQYQVVFMRRNPEEIQASFKAAFDKKIPSPQPAIDEGLQHLRNRRDVISVQEVWLNDVIDSGTIPELVGWPVDTDKASSVIDPSKLRFRKVESA